MNDKVVKTDYILENETPEQAFKRIMGEDYDPNKYDIRVGEGAMDDGYDNPLSTIEIVEKQQSISGIDVSTLSEEELGKILDNVPDANAIYMNDPVEGYVINGGPAGYQDIQNAYNALVQGKDAQAADQSVPEIDTTTAQQEQDPVLIEYSNSGYSKNAFGHYFNPNIDEYDENYDPHNDPLFNKDLANEQDPVLVEYSNSGYSKNAFGHYFNPNTDEYDENYDPHNDPLFNKDLTKTSGKTEEELFNDYVDIMNKLSDVLKVDPYANLQDVNLSDFALDVKEKEVAQGLIQQANDIRNENKAVSDKYNRVITDINNIRQSMANILRIESYPGIENEYEHAVEFQLDDWEKDQFAKLRDDLKVIKDQYPEMFNNIRTRVPEQKEIEDNQEAAPVDDNPQHAPNEETGYAVDGFQSPAVVGPVDDNPQHAPNPETGYAVDGFQAPAVVAPVAEESETFEIPLANSQKINRTKELLKNGLIVAGGFVVGVGLSCVPGVGTIRMAVATTKLAVTAVNAWSKKHPDGKVAHVRDFVYDKIPDNIKAGINKVQQWKATKPINLFVNGVAAGYIAGNVFEMITGSNVYDFAKDKLTASNVSDTVKTVDKAQYNNANNQTQPTQQPTTQPTQQPVQQVQQPTAQPTTQPATQPSTTTFDASKETMNGTFRSGTPSVPSTPDMSSLSDAVQSGAPVDLSGISYGMVSSDATNAVQLVQSAGKDATFLKEAIAPDGTKMWAFSQANGVDYAWFKAEDVLNELAKTGQNVVSQGISR